MRDILFRGKRIDTEQFVEGYLVNSNQDIWWIAQNRYSFGSVFNEYSCDDTFIWNRVMPETIGQFTGLYDKNGKKIFEGDIVSSRIAITNYQVMWENFGFVIKGEYGCEIRPTQNAINFLEVEVMGNIYDNPELIKGENEDERRD